MGQQVIGRVRFDGETHEGVMELEGGQVVFRGERRLRIPLSGVAAVLVEDGWLVLQTAKGEVRLEVGDHAERWAGKIRNPRTVWDKLGIKAGQVIAIRGLDDAAFESGLAARGATVTHDPPGRADLVFLYAPTVAELGDLRALRDAIAPKGAVWVLSPRGDPAIQDVHVIAAGKAAGLVDNKVARFSETLTALRFVIPVRDR